jgi:hypothetical protein
MPVEALDGGPVYGESPLVLWRPETLAESGKH